MSGDRWNKALNSLKEIVQIVSDINQDKNQVISLLSFNNNARVVFTGISPENFNIKAISFASGGTTFTPAFDAALNLMKNNADKNNIFIFISDGGA